MSKPINMTIFGCCMSRDPFDIYNELEINVTKFVSQNSFYVLLDNNLHSSHIRQLVKEFPWTKTWNKSCFELECDYKFDNLLSVYESDYIVLDAYNFTFNLLKFNVSNNLITQTHDFYHNNDFLYNYFLKYDCNYQIIYSENIPDYYLNNAVQIICKKILTHYKPSNIFLNTFSMAEYYFDGSKLVAFDNKEAIEKINSIMEKANAYFRKYFGPKINIIEMPKNVVGYLNHRWGLYNLHVVDEYYQYVMECIISTVKGIQDYSEIKNKYLKILQEKYYSGE